MRTVRIRMLENRDALRAGGIYNISEKAVIGLVKIGIEKGRSFFEYVDSIHETKPAHAQETKPIAPTETKPIAPAENKLKKNPSRTSKGKGF